jgi:prephenate dehydrogenase
MSNEPDNTAFDAARAAERCGFRRVAILGMGLMGGSLGLALKRLSGSISVCGYARRAETRRLALEMGACDRITDDPAEAVQGADLVVVCTPILEIPVLVANIRDALMDGAIVTDVGSTKAMLQDEVSKVLDGSPSCFIGSHPMAGSERTGMEAARVDLYEKAVVIITPAYAAGDGQIQRLSQLWESVGARVVSMDAAVHDEIVAGTSHVPHLVAALLVGSAARAAASPGVYCGPGFRDSTRIAGGSEFVWHDIVKSNTRAIEHGLEAFRDDLERLLATLKQGDYEAIREWLGRARKERERILATSQGLKGGEG